MGIEGSVKEDVDDDNAAPLSNKRVSALETAVIATVEDSLLASESDNPPNPNKEKVGCTFQAGVTGALSADIFGVATVNFFVLAAIFGMVTVGFFFIFGWGNKMVGTLLTAFSAVGVKAFVGSPHLVLVISPPATATLRALVTLQVLSSSSSFLFLSSSCCLFNSI